MAAGPPVWVHGDLHPFNLLVETGPRGDHLSAVVDFGDVTAGGLRRRPRDRLVDARPGGPDRLPRPGHRAGRQPGRALMGACPRLGRVDRLGARGQ
ncbi:phosphotransferase [Curtobacterium sp. MCPF17_052]|nr:phosphotransferase [Curtobacterium sp. MCPF17_052]WIB13809.1 phosphotransferase [Curtobacterium sp. MCPF17_052]